MAKKELQMKITINELAETTTQWSENAAQVSQSITVHCSLELDERERVNFQFNLNQETANDITNLIVNIFKVCFHNKMLFKAIFFLFSSRAVI
jgi:hypothetical protein